MSKTAVLGLLGVVTLLVAGCENPNKPPPGPSQVPQASPASICSPGPAPDHLMIRYNLTFSAPARRFTPVIVNLTGCELVSGLGSPTRWVARSPDFWVTLGEGVGLAHADEASFAG
jgi:hypothetical protein